MNRFFVVFLFSKEKKPKSVCFFRYLLFGVFLFTFEKKLFNVAHLKFLSQILFQSFVLTQCQSFA